MSHDIKCYQLAEAFLSEQPNYTGRDVDALAERIQVAIEDYIKFDLPESLQASKD